MDNVEQNTQVDTGTNEQPDQEQAQGTTITQAPPETDEQLAQDMQDSISENNGNGSQTQSMDEADAADSQVDERADADFEPMRLRPWQHPRTFERRVYAEQGDVSDLDSLFITPDGEDGGCAVHYLPATDPAYRSHDRINDDLQIYISSQLNLPPSTRVEFKQVWELALICEQKVREKQLAAKSERQAEDATETAA